MRLRSKLIVPAVFFMFCVAAANPAAALDDAIVAVVNDHVITLKDVKEYIQAVQSQLRIEGKDPVEIAEIVEQYEKKGIQQLIEDKLILDAANEKGIEINKDVIEKKFADIRARYKTEDQFITLLQKEGLTITDLKKRITDKMKVQYIMDVEVRSKVVVNPQEVTKFYRENLEKFKENAKVHLQSVFVSFLKGKEAARERASEARNKLIAGEDFDTVFKEYSELPSIGVVEEGKMIDSIESEVFALQEGEVSSLVEVENGIYVFKVTAKSAGSIPELTAVKDRIYGRLFEDKFRVKFKEWMAKLKKKAYVEIKS